MARKGAKKARKGKGKGRDPRVTLAPDKYLSDDQETRLIRHVRDQADAARQRGSTRAVVDEFLIMLLLRSGLRAAEACNLNLGDLPTAHGKPLLYVRNGKGNVRRTVDVGDKLKDRIRRFVSTFRNAAKDDEPLLVNERGGRYGYMSVYGKVRRLCRAAGIEGRKSPHCLRHTYAGLLYKQKRDILYVARQLGHADVSTTMIYARTFPEKAAEQLAGLEAADD